MSLRHPIISVTGSSGAGTTTVKHTFEQIFRREGVRAATIEGDAFHRFDRAEMRQRMAEETAAGNHHFSHFGPDSNLFEDLEATFRSYSETGTGRTRVYVHDAREAELHGADPGTFTVWTDLPEPTDLLFYEGLHGAVVTDSANVAQYGDLKIGVVPVINLEWIQKIHRDRSSRGHSTEAVTDTILRRMPDYINYICPQFTETDINFQRIPTVDTSDPFIARWIPTPDESMVVIRFKNPRGIDFLYLKAMLHDSFMSRANSIVIPGGKLDLAMQLILTPLILRLVRTQAEERLMARITLRQLLDHAAEHGYGVPAFNINNMEQGLAIMEAAQRCDAPVILQASRGARAYAGDIMLAKIMEALELMFPAIPIVIHQDHGNNVQTCLSAIQHGFTSVMMDGSLEEDAKTPADYAYNVRITGEVARLAHMVGASVEGELGCLGSLETGQGEAEDGHGFEGALDRGMLLTDPDEAARFVAETRVDALAVALGTSHGAYKFSRKPTGDILAMDVIEKIHARLPDTHIVMHGSSSVPEEWQAVFNAHGGEMRETYGVPVDELVRGIGMGVRKINIDTDLRLAAAAEFRRIAQTDRSEFDPRKFLKPSMTAMAAICRDRFEAFGTAGQAAKIRIVPIADMAKRYASGALDPRAAQPVAA